jgi:hypothetical protein
MEFGHVFDAVDGFHIDTFGVGPFVIEAGGRHWRFEDSDMFGPALCKLNGELRSNPYPPETSPFWRAHFLWRKQGRRIVGGLCEWHEPRPTIVKIIGREIFVVERGEDHGLTIDEETGKRIFTE